MGNCRSRATKPIESEEELLEKYEAAEYKIVGLTEHLQKYLETLHDVETKMQSLQANLERKIQEDKIKICEQEESPLKNNLHPKEITKRIHKTDQRDCAQKGKVIHHTKPISNRKTAISEKENLEGSCNNISAEKIKKEFEENSYISTPELFANTRRLMKADDFQVKVEYFGNTPVHSLSTRDINSSLAFSQCESSSNQKNFLDNETMERGIAKNLGRLY